MSLKNTPLFLLVLLAVTLTYSNHFHNSLHFDDSHAVTDNPYIRDLRNVPRFFTDGTTFSILPTNQSYRPIVSTSLALDYFAGRGYNVLWFHVSTFFWFLAQLAAMYALFAAILDRVRPDPANRVIAVLAVAWYGLHPANAETVNYIIQRGDVYSTLGVVAALALFACFPEWRKTGLYLAPFVLAMLSKPVAAIFPVLLLLYILLFEWNGGKRLGPALRQCIPAFVLSGLLTWLVSAMTPHSFTPAIVSRSSYLMTQPYVWLRYFEAFFLPTHLSADTDLRPFTSWNEPAIAGVIFILAILAAVWITARRPVLRPISFGLSWFIVTLLPTSIYPLSEVENDHRMFLPFVGFVIAVSWPIALLVEIYAARLPSVPVRRAAVIAAVCLMCAYAYGTRQRNEVWHTEESLWRDVTVKSPGNGRGLMNYGLTQMAQGRYAVGLDYFERAAVLNPQYYILEINLGVAYNAVGRPADAEPHFQRALALAPNDAQPYHFYGRWLDQMGRQAEALRLVETAVKLNPSWIENRALLMRLYAATGDLAHASEVAAGTLRISPGDREARQFLVNPPVQNADYWISASLRQYQAGHYQESVNAAREALKLKPDSFEAYNNIGAAYGAMQMYDLAIQNLREALRINPAFQLARNNLALYNGEKQHAVPPSTAEDFLNASLRYHQAGRYNESIAAARAALRLRPAYAEAYNNLAAAYEALGKWDDAIAAATEAVRIKPDFELAKNNLAWARQQKQRSP